jgi:hypothetical protein
MPSYPYEIVFEIHKCHRNWSRTEQVLLLQRAKDAVLDYSEYSKKQEARSKINITRAKVQSQGDNDIAGGGTKPSN